PPSSARGAGPPGRPGGGAGGAAPPARAAPWPGPPASGPPDPPPIRSLPLVPGRSSRSPRYHIPTGGAWLAHASYLPSPLLLRENMTHHAGGACRGGGDDDGCDGADRLMRGH